VASGVAHAVEDGTRRGSHRSEVDMLGIDAGVHYGLMAWELDQEEGVATFGEQWSTVIEPSFRGF